MDLLSGGCYDVSGYRWPCAALSPAALHFAEMDDSPGAAFNPADSFFSWVCPGKLMSLPRDQWFHASVMAFDRNLRSLWAAAPYLKKADDHLLQYGAALAQKEHACLLRQGAPDPDE